MPGLWDRYIAEEPALMAFYAYSPRALPVSAAARPWDPGLVDTLRAYQCDLGLARSFTGNEPVVITGQQPGIFTGPLYTIYKAVTAVLLAARIQRLSGAPCIPLFWIGADDHDFEELRVAHFLTKNHETLTLRYAPENEPGEAAVNVAGFPMYRVPITPSLHQLVDEAAAQTPGAEYREDVAAFLHHTLDQSRTLDEWFARLMAALFQDTQLMFFAPHLAAARLAAVPVFEREIREPLASTRLLNETAERLRKSGYPAQVVKNETECNFFIEMGGRRRKVLYEKERFRIRVRRMTCSLYCMPRRSGSAQTLCCAALCNKRCSRQRPAWWVRASWPIGLK